MIDLDAIEFDAESAEEDRRPYFLALDELRRGDAEAALKSFRRAARRCASPFDFLSTLAAGECHRLLDREGAAMKAWREVGEDEAAPHALRYSAWLSIAALAEARDNERALARANAQLDELGPPPGA